MDRRARAGIQRRGNDIRRRSVQLLYADFSFLFEDVKYYFYLHDVCLRLYVFTLFYVPCEIPWTCTRDATVTCVEGETICYVRVSKSRNTSNAV